MRKKTSPGNGSGHSGRERSACLIADWRATCAAGMGLCRSYDEAALQLQNGRGMQNPVPANVVRAVNYFQSPGWGAPLTAEPGFHGKLSNVDVGDDWTIAHISIDKSARIHAEISREIAALSQAKEGPQDGSANPLTAAAPQSQKKFPPQAEAQ